MNRTISKSRRNRYLARIGISRVRPLTLGFLTELQERHLKSIPFENLSVIWGEEIVLDEASLFEKVVDRSRGGFCYELNGLYAALLQSLGFRVDRVSARVHQSNGIFGPEFDHMALLVDLDCSYLVDVGFGDSCRQPLVLPDGEATDVSGRYRLRRAKAPDHFELQKLEPDGWTPQYRFSTIARKLDDYAAMCYFHRTSPESSFTQRTICTLATDSGRETLTEESLTITEGKRKSRTAYAAQSEQFELLHTYFGIDLVISQS